MTTESKRSAAPDLKGDEGLLRVKVKEEDSAWRQDACSQRSGSLKQELCQQLFRQFSYRGVAGPRRALSQLRELCRLWLRPETHSKDQMLEMLVLEQFLSILPAELRAWVREQHPRSGEEVVTMLEDVERGNSEAVFQVPVPGHGQEILRTKVAPLGPGLTVQFKPVDTKELPGSSETPLPLDCDNQSENNGSAPSLKVHGNMASQRFISGKPGFVSRESTEPQNIITSAGRTKRQQENKPGESQRPSPAQNGGFSKILTHKNMLSGEISHDGCDRGINLNSGDFTHQKSCKHSTYNQSLTWNSGFIKHQRIYSGEKNSQYGKSLRHPNLMKQAAVFGDEKTHQCHECRKAFRQSSKLTRHQRTHTGERPCECSECGKGFAGSSDLIRHQRIHTGGDPLNAKNVGELSA